MTDCTSDQSCQVSSGAQKDVNATEPQAVVCSVTSNHLLHNCPAQGLVSVTQAAASQQIRSSSCQQEESAGRHFCSRTAGKQLCAATASSSSKPIGRDCTPDNPARDHTSRRCSCPAGCPGNSERYGAIGKQHSSRTEAALLSYGPCIANSLSGEYAAGYRCTV